MAVTSSTSPVRFDFMLPPSLEAHVPPEARGLTRDAVRLMVARRSSRQLIHAAFRDLPDFLPAGSVLVLNTSATLPASLPARATDGSLLELHLSTPFPGGTGDLWTVELRRGSARFLDGRLGEMLFLPAGGTALILDAYPEPEDVCLPHSSRLWTARLRLACPLPTYLAQYGAPIRYGHIQGEWPVSAYQTAYGRRPGSAEMPSAGRPFTRDLLARLRRQGVEIVELVLNTGVSSQEADEVPFPEYYDVPAQTLERVRQARMDGRLVVATGTTAVRAIESAARGPLRGWTNLVITPDNPPRLINGLITGWHEPQASHLMMLEAIAGRQLLESSYAEAVKEGYLWHEFGDSELILP